MREASVAVLIANIPNCWSLIRRIFKLKSWNGTTINKSRTGTYASEYHQQRTLSSIICVDDISNPARFNAKQRQGSKFGSAFNEIEEIDATTDPYYLPQINEGRELATAIPTPVYRRDSQKIDDVEMLAENPFITSALDDIESDRRPSTRTDQPWLTWASPYDSPHTKKSTTAITMPKDSFDSSASSANT